MLSFLFWKWGHSHLVNAMQILVRQFLGKYFDRRSVWPHGSADEAQATLTRVRPPRVGSGFIWVNSFPHFDLFRIVLQLGLTLFPYSHLPMLITVTFVQVDSWPTSCWVVWLSPTVWWWKHSRKSFNPAQPIYYWLAGWSTHLCTVFVSFQSVFVRFLCFLFHCDRFW